MKQQITLPLSNTRHSGQIDLHDLHHHHTQSFQKQLDALPNEIFKRIALKIQQLENDPRPDGVTKIKGSDNEYRIRIGDYRVRYEIDDKNLIVLLVQCKHRKDLYRK